MNESWSCARASVRVASACTLKGCVLRAHVGSVSRIKGSSVSTVTALLSNKLVGKTSTPPDGGGGGKGQQTAEEWLKEQLGK